MRNKTDFDIGIAHYQNKNYNLAIQSFKSSDNTFSDLYEFLCKIHLDLLTEEDIDKNFIDNELNILKKELFYILITKKINLFYLKENTTFKSIFNLKLVDELLSILTEICDINEITEEERILSLYYNDINDVFASLFLYSKKFTDDKIHNINITDEEILKIKEINSDYYNSVKNMLETSKFMIEIKVINNYELNYSYNFYEDYNLFFNCSKALKEHKIDLAEELLTKLSKIKSKDFDKNKKINYLKIELSLLKNSFEESFESICLQMNYVKTDEEKMKGLIEEFLLKFSNEEDKEKLFIINDFFDIFK